MRTADSIFDVPAICLLIFVWPTPMDVFAPSIIFLKKKRCSFDAAAVSSALITMAATSAAERRRGLLPRARTIVL